MTALFGHIDLGAQAGHTGHRLRVTEAKRMRMDARHVLGTSRDDPPTVEEIIRAAGHLAKLLNDATEGDCCLRVVCDGHEMHPNVFLSTARAAREPMRGSVPR